MVMAVVMDGAIAAVAVIIMDGVEVAAITTVGGAVVIAAGIETHKREAASVGGLFHLIRC
jgi:hypothetical protein